MTIIFGPFLLYPNAPMMIGYCDTMSEHASATAFDFAGDIKKPMLEFLLAALPTALLYSLVLLVLSLVLVIMMHRRRLYTREARLWNILTKLHYPLWMFIFATFGFVLGLIGSFQSAADRAIDDKLRPVMAGMAPTLQQLVIANLPPELAEGPMTGQAIYDYVVQKAAYEGMLDQNAAPGDGFFTGIARKFENGVRQQMTKAAIDMAIVEVGAKVGLSQGQAEFSLETFKKIDFAQKADEIAGKVTDAIKQQVGGFATGIRLQCVIFSGVLLVLLLIEPLVYYKLVLPRKAKALEMAGGQMDQGRDA